ncbi:MAG: hypothetical protein ACLQIK_04065 [Mycobacterium sp.]|uniref:hypothetical protein n=1 Tax=Mycobacterium sp. TaxID=1785 RepID=UPI003F9C85F3
MAIIKFEHTSTEDFEPFPGNEYALDVDLDGELTTVIIKFIEADDGEANFSIAIPPDQMPKWERVAKREGKSAEEIAYATVAAAFEQLRRS